MLMGFSDMAVSVWALVPDDFLAVLEFALDMFGCFLGGPLPFRCQGCYGVSVAYDRGQSA
jgi:hypothetical protein